MGRIIKQAVAGFAVALMLAGGASAQWMLHDVEHGDNQNYIGEYWYYFVSDDNCALTNEVAAQYNVIVTNSAPPSPDGPMTMTAMSRTDPRLNASQQGSRAMLGDYVAAMIFDNWQTIAGGVDGTAGWPTIAMGTSLTVNDSTGIGGMFSGVDSIAFHMWAPEGADIRFKVETTNNVLPNQLVSTTECDGRPKMNSNTYSFIVKGTGEWNRYAVAIRGPNDKPPANTNASPTATTAGIAGQLMQEAGWGVNFAFDHAKATKVVWQINGNRNPNLNRGMLLIDNVRFIGNFSYTPEWVCNDCAGKTLPRPLVSVISDFEGAESECPTQGMLDSDRQNCQGYYWYHYTDQPVGGTSEISGRLTQDAYAGEDFVLEVGSWGNSGKGVEIQFDMGPMFTHNVSGEDLNSFVGVGTNFYDTLANGTYQSGSFINVSSGVGIYFEFKATGMQFVTVEVLDSSDLAFDDGEVYHKMIPVLNSGWNTVRINWDEFVLPRWKKRRAGNLNLTKLAKIQFKNSGSGSGTLAIDNVYFNADPASNIMYVGKRVQATGIRAAYNRGSVNVNWSAPQQIASGKISLVNTKGRVVSSASIANVTGNRVAVNLGKTLPTGMYFVRVDARDVNGKRIVQNAPVSIIK